MNYHPEIEHWRSRFIKTCNGYGIPIDCTEGLVAWAITGRPVGHFLSAVLANDLLNACGRADSRNSGLLRQYALLLYNDMPAGSYGSEAKVKAWQADCGLVGRIAKDEAGS